MTEYIVDPIIAAAMDKTADADRQWFRDHPKAKTRTRPMKPMEFGGLLPEIPDHIEGRWMVRVTYFADDLRAREAYFVRKE